MFRLGPKEYTIKKEDGNPTAIGVFMVPDDRCSLTPSEGRYRREPIKGGPALWPQLRES